MDGNVLHHSWWVNRGAGMFGVPTPGAGCRSCIAASCTLGGGTCSHFMEGETDGAWPVTPREGPGLQPGGDRECAVRRCWTVGTKSCWDSPWSGSQVPTWHLMEGWGDYILEWETRGKAVGDQGCGKGPEAKANSFSLHSAQSDHSPNWE